MKHSYTTCVLLLTAIGASAQHLQRDPVPPYQEDKHAGLAIPAKGEAGAPKGASYYNETFDADLNGWTVVSGAGDLDWAWTNTGPGPTSSTYPVPPLNTSTPSGWAIIDDDYLGTPGVEAESSLISPVIDLSLAPAALKLEFDQYFQEFSDPDVACWVGVSTNGGLSWDEVNINEGVGRDGRPNPELYDLNISDWVVGDPSNVQLRFRYIATWDYGWQIDNITITDLPNNDMAVLGGRQTDFNFDLTGLANIEYSVYPQEQIREMIPQGATKNKGYLAQTGVTLTVTVDEPGGGSVDLVSTTFDAVPGQIDSLGVEPYTPSALGTYDLTYVVAQQETDELPINNTTSNSFQVSDCYWGQDDGVLQSTYQAAGDNALEQVELGNYFDIANAGSTLYGIAVCLHENTPVGLPIYGIVYDIDGGQIAQTSDYEVQASDLNGVGESNWLVLPLEDELPMDAGTAYMVMIGGYGGADQVVFGTSGFSAPQVSLINYPNIAAPTFFYVTKTPMVRALLSPDCLGLGIAENGGAVTTVTAWPNPFTDNAQLAFELGTSATVSIEVHDMTGRLVMSEDLGRLAAGSHQRDLSGAQLASGTYSWTLLADGARRSGMIAKN